METTTHNGVTRAVDGAIERVDIDTTPLAYRYPPPYGERPTQYLVTFRGESRRRRVYATPIGNVSVFYVKTRGEQVIVDAALEVALRTEKAESTTTTPRTNVVANAMNAFGDMIFWGKVDGYNAYTSDSCGPYAVLVDDPADPGWRTWDELSEHEVSEKGHGHE